MQMDSHRPACNARSPSEAREDLERIFSKFTGLSPKCACSLTPLAAGRVWWSITPWASLKHISFVLMSAGLFYGAEGATSDRQMAVALRMINNFVNAMTGFCHHCRPWGRDFQRGFENKSRSTTWSWRRAFIWVFLSDMTKKICSRLSAR